jgi:hypothetical protein
MRKTLLSCLLVSLFAATPQAQAQHKPGQYTGVRKCTATGGGHYVNATSKRTIGVATCKGELQKALIAKGACIGKAKNTKVEFDFEFGSDKDPDQTKGSYWVTCR